MTSLSDGLANVYSLTDKINALKAGKIDPSIKTANDQPLDPDQALIDIAQSFNDLLNRLISDPDEEKKKIGNVNFITGALDNLGT